jgi:hypothetical protein
MQEINYLIHGVSWIGGFDKEDGTLEEPIKMNDKSRSKYLSWGSTFKWVISTLWLGFVTEHGTLVFSCI